MHLTPGSRVGPYEVVVLLGAGGMADVYRARDTRLGRDVAIKMIAEALGSDGPLRERFEREARLAGSLSHPNVVALYDVGFQDGKPYLVTELLRGETLRERLASGPVALVTALEWAAQMAEGLAAAHDRGIIHRDLKLENVFITRDGHVKLLDFGIAKVADQPPEPHGLMEATGAHTRWNTGAGLVLGTPGYMSPEQVRGDAVDARTDFFSLGALLYEMLAGRQAFAAGSVAETGYAVLHGEPAPLPATIPQPVAQVVRRCLEKDPGKRFQSARDLAFHLELLRAPTGSGQTTDVRSVQREAMDRTRTRWWVLTSLLAAVGVTGATYFVMQPVRAAPPSVERITFRNGNVSAGRFGPDGRVVYSAAWEGKPEEVFAGAPGTPELSVLGLRDARLLSVSAQGELAVALASTGGETLAIVPGSGGVPRQVAENVLSADWSPTGELAVVRSIAGKSQLEYPVGKPLFESTGWIAFPRVSPDGKTVAFFSQPNDAAPNALLLVDREGGIRRLAEGQLSGVAWEPSGRQVWFAEGSAIFASPLSGGRRLVYQGVGDMRLEDISREGKLLLQVVDVREQVTAITTEPPREVELPWLSASANDLAAISDDGRQVLFSDWLNGLYVAYLRPTDGSSPLKLGPGRPLAFSPDEKWVLLAGARDPSELFLLPVGVGERKRVPVEDLNVGAARWLRDGKRFVAVAQRKGEEQWRLFVVPLDGEAATPLSDSSVTPAGVTVSHDDRYAAVLDGDGTVALYALAGGPRIPLPSLGLGAIPIGWTSGGQLWASAKLSPSTPFPVKLRRYDIPTGRIVEERQLGPSDPNGIDLIERVWITPDSRTVAVQYFRTRGSLYTMDGLARSAR